MTLDEIKQYGADFNDVIELWRGLSEIHFLMDFLINIGCEVERNVDGCLLKTKYPVTIELLFDPLGIRVREYRQTEYRGLRKPAIREHSHDPH